MCLCLCVRACADSVQNVCDASLAQVDSKDMSAILLLVLSRVSNYLEKSGVPLVHAQLSEIVSPQAMELVRHSTLRCCAVADRFRETDLATVLCVCCVVLCILLHCVVLR